MRSLFVTIVLLLAAVDAKAASNGLQEFSLTVEKQPARRYFVHAPGNHKSSQPLPVVLNLHGGGGDAEGTAISTLMNDGADKHGYLVVYPEGTGKRYRGKLFAAWNAGACCGDARQTNIDDVAYVARLLEDLPKHFNIDAKRIYVTGLSNGAMMSYRLACGLSDKIAAIAPVSGQAVFECQPKRHVPTLHIHGTADICAPYNGGPRGDCFAKYFHALLPFLPEKKVTDPIDYPSVPDSVKKWAHLNGIEASTPAKEFFHHGKATCTTQKGASPDQEVAFCKIEDGGHSWPGGGEGRVCRDPSSRKCRLWREIVGPISNDLVANEVIWSFFEKHSL